MIVCSADCAGAVAVFDCASVFAADAADIGRTADTAVNHADIHYSACRAAEQTLTIFTGFIYNYTRYGVAVTAEFAGEFGCAIADSSPVAAARCGCCEGDVGCEDVVAAKVVVYVLKLFGCGYFGVGLPIVRAIRAEVVILFFVCSCQAYSVERGECIGFLAVVAFCFGNVASRADCPYSGVKAGGEGRAAEGGGGYAGCTTVNI